MATGGWVKVVETHHREHHVETGEPTRKDRNRVGWPSRRRPAVCRARAGSLVSPCLDARPRFRTMSRNAAAPAGCCDGLLRPGTHGSSLHVRRRGRNLAVDLSGWVSREIFSSLAPGISPCAPARSPLSEIQRSLGGNHEDLIECSWRGYPETPGNVPECQAMPAPLSGHRIISLSTKY